MNEPLKLFADMYTCMYLQMLIIIPLAAGVLFFAIPERFQTVKGILALATTLVTGYLAIALYSAGPQM
ncbi:MAG: hypothetical protein IH592_07005, partial [Bacteroidales bacterium]|nr:hypothetical protein [Bacteroidales bacterium]MBE0678497.1 hypothetical protein [Bacteroidales bacterium]